MVRRIALAAGLALLGACSAETVARTQLMLVSDTNLVIGDADAPATAATKDEVVAIRFEVIDPKGTREPAKSEAVVTRSAPPPRSVGLLHDGGSMGPLVARATALNSAGETILTREHVVSFVKGKTLIVPLHLASACLKLEEPCGSDQTCTESGCAPRELKKLDAWSGDEPRVDGWHDAGTDGDGGSDGPMPMDGGMDAGRDGGNPPRDAGQDASAVDSMVPQVDASAACGDAGVVDTNANLQHCGGCFMPCPPPPANADAVCVNGNCGVECQTGWGNCDTSNDDCEVFIAGDSRTHCGGCNQECKAVGQRECIEGVCRRP